MATVSSVNKSRQSSFEQHVTVWDRIWRQQTSTDKDRSVLERERRSPRWRSALFAMESTFGRLAGLRTVELGSGRADFSALMAMEGAEVTLIDYSVGALERASDRFDRLRLPVVLEQRDFLADMSDLAGVFDVSASLGVVEHFRGSDRRRVIGLHAEVIRPGGLVLVSMPNAWCIPYRLWKMALESTGRWPYGMELPYHRVELARCATEAGLIDVRIDGFGFWQSVGDHCVKGLCGTGPDWVDKPSLLDARMGASWLLAARRPPFSQQQACDVSRGEFTSGVAEHDTAM